MKYGLTFKRRLSRAFSLVELSIVLAISGVMITGGLLVSTILLENSALDDTLERINQLDTSIKEFVQVNGYLPCPASPTLTLNNATFGAETRSGINCTASNGVVSASGAFIGAVPTRALGLPNEMMADAFGNRFIYAVTGTLVNRDQFFETDDNDNDGDGSTLDDRYEGTINIANRFVNNVHSNIAYVLVSTGLNGNSYGGRRLKTGNEGGTCNAYVPAATPSTTIAPDNENCDGDDIFMDTRYNPGTQLGFYYDDIIRYSNKFNLKEADLTSGQQLCDASNDGLTRYDEGRERMQECDGTDWQDLSVNGYSSDTTRPTECFPHQEDTIRRTSDTTDTFDYCNSTTWQWTTISVAGCAAPWGGVVSNGGTVTAYSASTPPGGQTCADISETRTCTGGSLTGSFTEQNCSDSCPAGAVSWGSGCSATLPAGTPGQNRTASDGSLPSTGSRPYTCSGGAWTPTGAGSCSTCTPTNGGWSAWGAWSCYSSGACDHTPTQIRYRTCNNPSPSCGGSACTGPSQEWGASCGAPPACPAGQYCDGIGACLPIPSDARLKTDILQVASTAEFGIYEYRYIGDGSGTRYRGVMAQEVMHIPGAVVRMPNGYYGVHYNLLGVPFERLN